MTLCELCGRQKAVFKITIQTILNSQHVPYGKTKMFGICKDCLPFEIVRETTETVVITKKRKTTEPL